MNTKNPTSKPTRKEAEDADEAREHRREGYMDC